MTLYYARANDTYEVQESVGVDLTTVVVTHLPSGTRATGNALRYYADSYNEQIGRNLAYYRAFERLSKKLQRKIIHSLRA